jgi:hypothetical protein
MTTRLIIHRREPTGHVFEQKAGDELAITLPPEGVYLFDPESGWTLALRDQTPFASPRGVEPARYTSSRAALISAG